MLRYLNTCALPYKEFAKEWLFDGEILSTSIFETGAGIRLICKLLQLWHGQDVESEDKTRREREIQ